MCSIGLEESSLVWSCRSRWAADNLSRARLKMTSIKRRKLENTICSQKLLRLYIRPRYTNGGYTFAPSTNIFSDFSRQGSWEKASWSSWLTACRVRIVCTCREMIDLQADVKNDANRCKDQSWIVIHCSLEDVCRYTFAPMGHTEECTRPKLGQMYSALVGLTKTGVDSVPDAISRIGKRQT